MIQSTKAAAAAAAAAGSGTANNLTNGTCKMNNGTSNNKGASRTLDEMNTLNASSNSTHGTSNGADVGMDQDEIMDTPSPSHLIQNGFQNGSANDGPCEEMGKFELASFPRAF